MLDKILLTISIALYSIAVPYLEINDTHVFNRDWVAHARLHEVWQLITNSALGAIALWLTWMSVDGKGKASVIALVVTGGFLAAYALQGLYGGSMVHPDGTEKTVSGINVGVIGFGWVFVSSVFTLVRAGRLSVMQQES